MRPSLLRTILFISFSAILLGTGCKKAATTAVTPPSLTTADVILDVTSTSAQSGGTIVNVGSSALTANGVCYSSTVQTPTLADAVTKEPLIYYSYTFTSNLTGLTPNTTYYVRAYATNAFGTSYGAVVKFTTSSTLSAVTGAVTTFAGSASAGYADGVGPAAQFSNPQGIAVDASGNVYVSDSFNNRIRKIEPDGTVTTIAGNGTPGYADGAAADAEFYAPQGLAVDAQGNLFVADYGNNVIREITSAGVVSTFSGNTTAGYVNGAATVAEFNGPTGIAVDKQGNLFVADRNNNMIRKVTSAGVVSLVAGTLIPGYVNATVNTSTSLYGSFRKPTGIVLDAAGNIYVADNGNSAIREITAAGVISTLGGGPGQSTLLGYPAGICIDTLGDFFITDESGRIIELTASKVLYILAGNANVTGSAEGSGTAAQFNTPQGIGIDNAGNIYVADSNNNEIRKVVVTNTNQ
ncbi:MAG: NHL repeat-containing protein [Mucilaginibacter sp.]